jgi:hypothetical protein
LEIFISVHPAREILVDLDPDLRAQRFLSIAPGRGKAALTQHGSTTLAKGVHPQRPARKAFR